ncbi:hypothetical protein Aab01nite_06400 [Paractinoplanes abujensis]|nr:hypothetical protein Aab01nite_06400 [Actinoplanes abujensis]
MAGPGGTLTLIMVGGGVREAADALARVVARTGRLAGTRGGSDRNRQDRPGGRDRSR